MKSEKKHYRGEQICSLDELSKQNRIYWKRKPFLRHSFGKWSLEFISAAIRKNAIYYSMNAETQVKCCQNQGGAA